MIDKLEQKMILPPSLCDCSGKIAIPEIFSLFTDVATAHANLLGLGYYDLAPKDLYWIAAKNIFTINRRPKMADEITITTWPEKPKGASYIRDYVISSADGETLITGKTQWAVINIKTGKLCSVNDIYPLKDDLNFPSNPEQFSRIRFSAAEQPADGKQSGPQELGQYIIKSTDIDVGQHMNNIAYIRAFERFFSTKEWEALNIKSMEVHFKNQCYEGDTLTYLMEKQESPEGAMQTIAAAQLPDGTVALQMKIQANQ